MDGRSPAFDGGVAGFGEDITFGRLPSPLELPDSGGFGLDGRSSAFDGGVAGFGEDIMFGRLPFPFEVPVPAVGGRGTGRLAIAGVAGDAGVAGFAEPAGFADTGRILACGGRGTLCTEVAGWVCPAFIADRESDAGLGAEAAGDPGFVGCAAFGIAPRTGCIG